MLFRKTAKYNRVGFRGPLPLASFSFSALPWRSSYETVTIRFEAGKVAQVEIKSDAHGSTKDLPSPVLTYLQ